MYIIILRRNPYQYMTGDSVYTFEKEEEFKRHRESLSNIPMPDLNDAMLEAQGFPGFSYLSMECYKGELI